MSNALFVAALFALCAAVLSTSFRVLPRERWQIMAAVPTIRGDHGVWRARNVTFYGLFIALSVVSATALMLFLLGSIDVSVSLAIALIAVALAVCLPASKIIARIVEKKQHTFTIGGASFLGILIAPAIVWMVNGLAAHWSIAPIPLAAALSALSIGYGFGEGMGRLGCISFGCCYGKPLSQMGPLTRRLFRKMNFVFAGKTKKVAYEGGLDGQEVLPIQALTAVIYVTTALAGVYLYLERHFFFAFILCMGVTQTWRAFSETLRADYRGEGSISAYQIMAMAAIVYCLVIALILPDQPGAQPVLSKGLASIWNPGVILLLQALGIAVFLFLGRSSVTEADVSFRVRLDRV